MLQSSYSCICIHLASTDYGNHLQLCANNNLYNYIYVATDQLSHIAVYSYSYLVLWCIHVY